MPYIILNADKSVLLRLSDNTIDNTTTSLTLVGRDYQGFGRFVNQNFVTLLSNSADIGPPENPIPGQLWFDISDRRLKVYDDVVNEFTTVGAASTVPSGLSVGEFWFDIDNQILKVFNGSNFISMASSPDFYNNTTVGPSGWVVPPNPIRDNSPGGGFTKEVVVLKTFGIGTGALTVEEPFSVGEDDTNLYFSRSGQQNFNLVSGLTIIGDISATNGLSASSGQVKVSNFQTTQNDLVPQDEFYSDQRADLITLVNSNVTATNANKFVRIDLDGKLIVRNSNDTRDIFILDDFGNLTINGTTAAISTVTGALAIVGGVGIGGDLFVGGQIEIVNSAATSNTPGNSSTPASWLQINVNNSTYYLPLYQ